MSQLNKLTDLTIKKLKAKDSRYMKADGDGLTLHVLPNGGRFWYFRYRFDGKINGSLAALLVNISRMSALDR